MKKIVKLTESDLVRIVKKIVKEGKTRRELKLKEKLNKIFFGQDEMNLFSEPGEYGYLSSEHRLNKDISPKQRIERMQQVIEDLEDYIKDLKYDMSSEESYIQNPDYESVWKDVDSDM
jgi:hypothetical protein